METPYQYLETKLKRAFSQNLENRPRMEYVISVVDNKKNSLKIKGKWRKSGREVILVKEELLNFINKVQLNDCLSDILIKTLEKYMWWPN
ncbi:hypothetical protein FIV31_00065 [Coxiella endosymbiont of Ornithodoros amblus]|uniref:hypothetical protein n=1 Tax=Coxiella endosymbiont of Ornithodoros amblus TaxID=1656166 RepID=UPI00244DE9D8|nr:hypothetical protein [Coxiella endosymbiont of Ornithodoros amblus]MBW5802256.1 hypothetical protein [Coxiella endosymbiont of Ornithodoros amblus]